MGDALRGRSKLLQGPVATAQDEAAPFDKVNVQLRPDLNRRIRVLAVQRGLKLHEVFNQAVEAYLQREEA